MPHTGYATQAAPHETHYDCQVGLSRRRLSSMCAGCGRQPEASSHIATAAALITAAAVAAAWQIITIERDADSTETVQRETETETATATGDGGADSAQKSMTSLWHAASFCSPLPLRSLCACALKVLAAGNSCCCCLCCSLHSSVAILIGIVSLCAVAAATF